MKQRIETLFEAIDALRGSVPGWVLWLKILVIVMVILVSFLPISVKEVPRNEDQRFSLPRVWKLS